MFLGLREAASCVAAVAWLTGCEPCAVVLSGHCTDAQHDEDTARDHGGAPGEQILAPPAPFYVPHSRG